MADDNKEIVYNIRVQSEDAKRSLENFLQTMQGTGQAGAAAMQPISGGFDQIDKKLNESKGVWAEYGTAITAAIGIAGTALIAFGHETIKAFMEAEDANMKVASAIRATGGAAGVTQELIDELAESYMGMTKADDEVIKGAASMLLLYKNINQDIFPETLSLTLDLAETMGTDASSAARQLGRALEDPTSGMMALRRAGIVFTEEEKEVIKSMMESNNLAEAQRVILDKLTNTIGGRAADAAKTLSGQIAQMNVRWVEMQEAIGMKVGPVLKDLIAMFPNLSMVVVAAGEKIFALGEALAGQAAVAFPLWVGMIKNAQLNFTPLVGALGTFGTALGVIGAALGVAALAVGAFLVAFREIQYQQAFNEEQKKTIDVMQKLKTAGFGNDQIQAMKSASEQMAGFGDATKQFGLLADEAIKKVKPLTGEILLWTDAQDKATKSLNYHKITIGEQIAAIDKEIAVLIKSHGTNEKYNELLSKREALVKEGIKVQQESIMKSGDEAAKLDVLRQKLGEVNYQKEIFNARWKLGHQLLKDELEILGPINDKLIDYGIGMKDAAAQYEPLAKMTGKWVELSDILPEVPPLMFKTDEAMKTLGLTSDATLDDMRAKFKQMAESGQLSAEQIAKAQENIAKAAGEQAQKTRDVWAKQVSTIVSDMGKGIADMIIEWKSFGESMIGIAKQIASSVLRIFIESLMAPLLSGLSGIFNSLLGGGIKTGATGLIGSGSGLGILDLLGVGGKKGGLNLAGGAGILGLLGLGGAGIGSLALGGASLGGLGAAAMPAWMLAGPTVPGLTGAGLTSGAAASGGLMGMIGGFLTNPWTIGIGGGIALGILLKKLLTKDAIESGAKEAARDLGGIEIGKDVIQSFLTSVGLTKDQFEGIRKEIESSPLFLTTVALPAAQEQGRVEQFLAALASGYSPQFAAAMQEGIDTGNYEALNREYAEWESHFKALGAIMPDYITKLAAVSDGTTALEKSTKAATEALKKEREQAAQTFTDMASEFMQTGQLSEDFVQQIYKAGGSLAAFQIAQESISNLQQLQKEFAGLKQSITGMLTPLKTWQDTFLETGYLTDEARKKIMQAGGDIAKFNEFSNAKSIKETWESISKTFLDTGVSSNQLKSMLLQYGGSEVMASFLALEDMARKAGVSITELASNNKDAAAALSFIMSETGKGVQDMFEEAGQALVTELDKMNENIQKAINILTEALVKMIRDLINVILGVPGAAEQAAADANYFLDQIKDKTVTVSFVVVTSLLDERNILPTIGRIVTRSGSNRDITATLDMSGNQNYTPTTLGARTAIPRMQEGGIVLRPTLALIGERGPEAVVPLNKGAGAGVTLNIQIDKVVASDDPQLFVDNLLKLASTNRFGLKQKLKTLVT